MAIIVMVCVLGMSTALVPFCSNLWQLYLSVTVSIIGGGAFDCGGGVWLVEMWGQNSATILQLSKAANGMGIIVGPLLDEPYLLGELRIHNLTQFHNNKTAIVEAEEALNLSIDRRTKLMTPFLVGGGIALVCN